MEQVRIAILSNYDKVCAFMDNEAPKALHYYEDELQQYLKGSASTFSCKASARHEDSEYLVEGNKLAFRYRDRDYYLNIMSVVRDEWEVEVEAYSLNFELLNEEKDAYKAASAMSFAGYLDVFDYENVVTLGVNEVSEKSIKHEWTGTSTMLARIFSLATVFGAEAEFVPQLNDDFSLKRVVLNVYRAYSDSGQGIGSNRTDTTLRYGKNVSGITKKSDILDLCTAIRPFGRDGLTVTSLDKKEYDANGKLEYYSPAGNRNIHAVQARDRFPSNLMGKENDRYIAKIWEYDTDNVNTLYGQALAELKKLCVPQVSYEVEGSFDVDIGDTVMIADGEYTPELYLQARVTEQRVSFTEPTRNKTTFDNFKELQSEVNENLLAEMQKLINENKVYTCGISTDNGVVFKNGMGSTTLTASIMDVGKDVTGNFTLQWYKDGIVLCQGKTAVVRAADVPDKAVYRFDAMDSTLTIKGTYEVTVSNVQDGRNGQDGEPGEPGPAGDSGNGIEHTTKYYLASASIDGVTPDTEGWTTTMQMMTTSKRYLWSYEVTTYTNGSVSTMIPIIMGTHGDTGPAGESGQDGQMLYATCGTAGATAAKVAILAEGNLVLKAGATVAVRFTNANTAANPTLSISGLAAKAIYTQGVPYAYWSAGSTVVFTYDGTYWRVASEPVYAPTATIGNPAGFNLYIEGNSIKIRRGNEILSTFFGWGMNVGGEIGAGKSRTDVSEGSVFLSKQIDVESSKTRDLYIEPAGILVGDNLGTPIGAVQFNKDGAVDIGKLYSRGTNILNAINTINDRLTDLENNKANIGSRLLLYSGSLGTGQSAAISSAWKKYNVFMARTSDGATVMFGAKDKTGGGTIRFVGGYDDGTNSWMFKANMTIDSSNRLKNIACSRHKYLTATTGAGQGQVLNIVEVWAVI